jgi:hypothetical protein
VLDLQHGEPMLQLGQRLARQWHEPLWHVSGLVHLVPHVPQLFESVCSLTHAPLHRL